MDTRTIVELVLLAVIVLNVVVFSAGVLQALKAVTRALAEVNAKLQVLQTEVVPVLRETKTALERIEQLTASADSLVRSELAPTVQITRTAVTHVEAATRAVSQTAQNVAQIASLVRTVTEPANVSSAAGRVLKLSANKLGLLMIGVRTGLRALLPNGNKSKQLVITKEEGQRRDTDGAAG
ncbi:MAG: hypothetical protein ACP5VE_07665 [Chthonomonadales bacterium]